MCAPAAAAASKGDDEVLFSGEFWSGRRAIALGLVDGLGDLRGILRDRFGERVRIRPVAVRRGLRRRLGLGTGAAFGGIDAGAMGAELLAALDEWAMWKRFGL